MPSIIQPTKSFVKSKTSSLILEEKGAKLEKELTAKLLEIYEKLNIVFMGTPEFAVPILEELCQSYFKPNVVITAPDKPTGRSQELTPPPIKIAAQNNKIPVFQPETKDDLIKQTLALKPDLIVVAAYGKILPKQILGFPKYGSINVHPSLLPKYRGPSPIQFPILNGEAKTGVTIMLINERMDEGAILAQETVEIEKCETAKTLGEKLSVVAAKLLAATLNRWIISNEMKNARQLIYPQEQDHSKATYTRILTKQDGKIIWNKSAKELDQQIRAFTPWPGSFTIFKTADPSGENKKLLKIKILAASFLKLQTDKELGQVFLNNKQLCVQTGKDCLIIKQLQLEGGKSMSAQEFLNGHPEIIGAILQ